MGATFESTQEMAEWARRRAQANRLANERDMSEFHGWPGALAVAPCSGWVSADELLSLASEFDVLAAGRVDGSGLSLAAREIRLIASIANGRKPTTNREIA